MNLADLTVIVAERHGLDKARAKAIVTDIFEQILTAAKNGNETSISGFGKFAVRQLPEREARNPSTGASVTVPATNKFKFTPAKAIKTALNSHAD